jgi:hypothetical protein
VKQPVVKQQYICSFARFPKKLAIAGQDRIQLNLPLALEPSQPAGICREGFRSTLIATSRFTLVSHGRDESRPFTLADRRGIS